MKTLKLLFIGTLCLVAASCSNNTKSENTVNDKDKTENTAENQSEEDVPVVILPNKSVDSITPAQTKKLKKYLKSSTIEEFSAFINTLRFAKTDTAFEKAYHGAKPLIAKMEKEFSAKNSDPIELMEQLEFMEDIFAMEPSCVAECTEFVILYDLEDLQKLAKETEGSADDEFFRMKEFCEGEEATYNPGWFTYFERTWDYGGGVLLGNNTIYTFLKDSYNFQKKSTLFKADIDQLREETIGIMGHPVYMKSKDKVQAEIDKIIKQKLVSAAEKKRIMEIRNRNEAGDVAKDPLLQFGCESGDCDWGG